ncbi:MAG TPA: cobalamin-dependent protein [Phycisphaerae bacterium]|nr:cobalamin-dependent protein [Phycisphaerae bacterium]
MNKEALQLSRSLEAVSRALARWTVERHASADKTLPDRYGASWQADWVANVEARLAYLAQAVGVRCPDVFSASVLWNREAIATREGRVDDLQASLRHMRAVFADELPPPIACVATECVDAALVALDQPQSPESADESDKRHRDARLRFLEHLLSSKRREGIELVMALSQSGVPVTEIYTSVLDPAQAEIGRMWHRHEISIADEHYATAATQELMSRLRAIASPANRRDLRVVAAAIGGDFHEIGIRMVADCFELDGWDVAYLGANLPAFEAVRELRERKAHLLALSASTFLHLRDVGELIDAVRAEPGCAPVKVIVGGPPFNLIPSLWQELGADGHARTATDAVALGNRLVLQNLRN